MQLNLKNKALPHIGFIALFCLILIAYFPSAFFKEKTMSQNDVMQGIAAGKEAMDYREKTGQEALWTTTMFSGMPLYLTNVVYSGDFALKINQVTNILPSPANSILLSFLCFYVLMSVIGTRPVVSFIGAFIYAFSTYSIIFIEAGHMYKVWAIAYMPLIFAGVWLVFDKKYIWGVFLTGLGLALELGAQHYQITYYMVFVLVFFGLTKLVQFIKEKEYKHIMVSVALLLLGAAIGVGVNVGRLWAVNEYTKYSTRGKSEIKATEQAVQGESGLDRDYVFAWSQGISETLTLLVPNFYGGASNAEMDKNSSTYEALKKAGVPSAEIKNFMKNVPMYWGDQPFTSGPVYTGIIIIFLFALSFFVLKPEEKYWAYIAIVLAILLSWGKNFSEFNYLVYDYFPGYNKFRAVSTTLVVAIFCIILIGTLSLNRLLDKGLDLSLKNIVLKTLAVVGGILVLIFVFSGMPDFVGEADAQLPEWLTSAIREDRGRLLRMDTFRSLFLTIAMAGLFYLYLMNRFKWQALLTGVILLMIFDLYIVDKRFLNENNFAKKARETFFHKTVADEMILADTSNYRVLFAPNPFNNALVSYYHKSVGGYHGAKMRRYQDLIERHLNKNNLKVFNMLNMKYVITGDEKNPVQKNPGALGSAWLVKDIKEVKNPDEEINALTDFEPTQTAIVDASKFKVSQKTFADTGNVELKTYDPNYIKYKVSAPDKAFVVFSEIYYPEGWKAFIDNKETDITRVNYVLRGMEIPAGEHIVEFKFEPKSYFVGNKLMMASSSLLLLLFFAGLFTEFKKKKDYKF